MLLAAFRSVARPTLLSSRTGARGTCAQRRQTMCTKKVEEGGARVVEMCTAAAVQGLRAQYSSEVIGESDVDPVEQFGSWFNEAVASAKEAGKNARWEANAMCLSTVSKEGRPSSRMVLLKAFDRDGFVWYSNYESRKGCELETNEFASLVFWWPPLERSVRIEGVVARVSDAESDAYFNARPPTSRIAAVASQQSRPVASAELLRDRYQALCAEYLEDDGTLRRSIERPTHWGGYRLQADRIEFWKGRTARMHDRIVYSLSDDEWSVQRLQP